MPNLRQLLRELEQRSRRRGLRAEHLCFDRQLAFVRDSARFRVAVCSRRAGKTVACAILLLERAIASPRTNHVYITLSRLNAKRIIWRELIDLASRFDLGCVANETELELRLPNGSKVYLSGAKDAGEVEKFRGLSLSTVVIDEGQSFRSHLRQLIDDVIVPCLWDVQGHLVLIGTPGAVLAGPFYDAWTAASWSKHSWTIADNPWILRKSGKTPDEILAEERARRGITEEDPTYQRESLGRWVRDEQSLVLRYDAGRNGYLSIPDGQWEYVIGIDLGTDDADAIAVLGWRAGCKDLYLIEEHVQSGQSITDLMEQVTRLRARYQPRRMVADTGGLGKKVVLEMRKRWGVSVDPADKTRKLEHLALLNDDLRTGRFRARAESRFAQDSQLITWDPDHRGAKISDSYHSDIADAVLYAHRAAAHYMEEAPEQRKDPGKEFEEHLIARANRPREFWEPD